MEVDELEDVIGVLKGDLYGRRIAKKLRPKEAVPESPPGPSLEEQAAWQQAIPQIGPGSIRYLRFIPWDGVQRQKFTSPYKFRLIGTAASLVKHLLEQNGFEETTSSDATIIWNNGVVRPETYAAMTAYQKINHFPKSFEMTRKDLLYNNITRAGARLKGVYNYVPQTYVLPNEMARFLQNSQKKQSLYIVKPHNSSQGRGIWLSRKPEQIVKRVTDTVVVSQYIQNPLLLDGLKFDLRIYIGISSFNPLRIYMYKDGLARFATYRYDKGDLENPYVHLTNYSLNKHSDQFVDSPQDDSGSKWSLEALLHRLEKEGVDVHLMMSRIDELVIKTIISIETPVFAASESSVPFRNNCFELLGFDVLVDQYLKPWLLEVNLSPSLNTDSQIDLRIKGGAIADMFTLIGIVPVDQRFAQDKSYLLNENKPAKKGVPLKTDFGRRQYSKQERLILNETEEEDKRRMGWRKIFPLADSGKYKRLFEVDRHYNALLRDFEEKKHRQGKPDFSRKK